MPIIASESNPLPNDQPRHPLAPTDITNQEKARRTYVDKIPIESKPRVYDLRVRQDAYLDFLFVDDDGNPQDLNGTYPHDSNNDTVNESDMPDPDVGFKAFIREAVTGCRPMECETTITDINNGKISIHVTPEQTSLPGIYNGEVICYPTNNPKAIIKTCPFYLYITYGLNNANSCSLMPLSEIRLMLRDTSLEENLLIDGLNFTDEEIMLATKLTIQKFNDIPPRENFPIFNSTSFPFKSILLEGIQGQLFFMAAEWHRKNNLQYSAGGVSLNDKNKEPNYLQAGQMHWQEFLQLAKAEKVKLNMDLNWGTISSAYAHAWY